MARDGEKYLLSETKQYLFSFWTSWVKHESCLSWEACMFPVTCCAGAKICQDTLKACKSWFNFPVSQQFPDLLILLSTKLDALLQLVAVISEVVGKLHHKPEVSEHRRSQKNATSNVSSPMWHRVNASFLILGPYSQSWPYLVTYSEITTSL